MLIYTGTYCVPCSSQAQRGYNFGFALLVFREVMLFLQRGFVRGFLRFSFATNPLLSWVFPGLPNGEALPGRITTRQPSWRSRPRERWLAGTATAACVASESDHCVQTHSIYYFVRYLNDVVMHSVMAVWGWRELRMWKYCSLV